MSVPLCGYVHTGVHVCMDFRRGCPIPLDLELKEDVDLLMGVLDNRVLKHFSSPKGDHLD